VKFKTLIIAALSAVAAWSAMAAEVTSVKKLVQIQ